MKNRLLSLLMNTTALRAPDDGGGASDGAAAAASSEPAAVERPSDLPEAYWDAEAKAPKFADLGKDLGELTELRALKAEKLPAIEAYEARRKDVPESAEDYEPVLPKDFKLPDGQAFEIPNDDPLLAEARTWAAKVGLTKDEFSELIAMRAKLEGGDTEHLRELAAAELSKLGTKALDRITAVEKFLGDAYGDKGRRLSEVMFTADMFEVIEDLMEKSTRTDDGAGYKRLGGGGRPTELSEEDWEAMSPTDRINYARQQAAKKAA